MTVLQLIYDKLEKVASIAGYNLLVTKKLPSNSYEPVLPLATYAPWLTDKKFNAVYKTIKDYTLIDKYRLYELWQLVEESTKLSGEFIEVGVWKGGSAALIAQKAKNSGIKDKVYLCDTFTGVVKAGDKDTNYKGGEHSDASKDIVDKLIHNLKLDNVKILVGIFPDETGKLIEKKNFRFCHIDVDVHQSAKDIVEWIWPKLVVGGMIVFDDYGFYECEGIAKLINNERKKKDRLVVHNLNGHAILIKLH